MCNPFLAELEILLEEQTIAWKQQDNGEQVDKEKMRDLTARICELQSKLNGSSTNAVDKRRAGMLCCFFVVMLRCFNQCIFIRLFSQFYSAPKNKMIIPMTMSVKVAAKVIVLVQLAKVSLNEMGVYNDGFC